MFIGYIDISARIWTREIL